MKMTRNFKLQFACAPLTVSASSIEESHASGVWDVFTTQDLHHRHIERRYVSESVQFIPRDLESDAALPVKRVVEVQSPAHNEIDDDAATEDAIRSGDWRLLAERASREMDSDKLMSLVEELNRVLEESQRKRPSE